MDAEATSVQKIEAALPKRRMSHTARCKKAEDEQVTVVVRVVVKTSVHV